MMEPTRDGEVDHYASCNAPIIWLGHVKTHRLAPIDAEPSESGNIFVRRQEGTYEIVARADLEMARMRLRLHLNHFATCPQAHAWHKSSPAPKRKEGA